MFAEVPLFPDQASTYATRVDAFFFFLLGVTGFFAILIAVLVLYFAIKYRRRSEDERPKGSVGSLRLETAWTVVPLLLALYIWYWGAELFFMWARPPNDALEIYVVAKQWMWKAQHLTGQQEINQIHVPLNQPVKLTMISQDVIHSFFVPAFRVHQDVLPNRYTTVWFQATKPGKFQLFCSQYCGTNHSKMIGEIVVMEPERFKSWLEIGTDGSLATQGRKLFQKLQCVVCHSADARARGPVLESLYETQVPLQAGRVLADDAYLRESILFPDAKIKAGFQPIMPSYKGLVNEEEVRQLLAFIKSLKPGETPRRTEDAEPPIAVPGLPPAKGRAP